MSIINDALKKAQVNLKKTDKNPEEKNEEEASPTANKEPTNIYEKLYYNQKKAQGTSPSAKKNKGKPSDKNFVPQRSTKKWLKNIGIVTLCLLCASGSLIFISRYQPFQDFFQSTTRNKSSSKRQIKAPVKKRRYKSDDLVLNGTSLIDDKRVALINDKIYEIGEMVNGKKITNINLNRVELQSDEEIITLRVH